ncbi:OadG family protein [Candidatus Merdisoma sp. HCP28S3_D10]|uniref:OadG family protein n=1 Tax=unclassified Candidatus Merdisoma TaxID=3099611 RepID=UPI003F8B9B07
MKRSLNKLSALLLLMGLLVLTGCGAKEALPEEELYQSKLDSCVNMLVGTDAATLEAQLNNLEENYDDFEQQVALYPYIGGTGQKFDFTADAYLSLLKSYDANLDELGDFVGVEEYEGGTTDKDGNVTYSAVYEFTDHNMRLSLEFDKDNIITTVTMDPIYSKGEIAEKAALNTLIGMGSVFAVLILLAFIISLFRYVSVFENRGKKKAETEKAAAPVPAAAAPVEAAPADDLQLIAVITAAIAAAEGTSADGFVVRSIKRRSNNKWKKA